MALKSIEQVPSLVDRLNNVKLWRFDPARAELQTGIISGIVLEHSSTGTYARTTSGQALVEGTLFNVPARSNMILTTNAWNCLWVDDAGAVQLDNTGFPGTPHAKIACVYNDSNKLRLHDLSAGRRDTLLGLDRERKAFIAPHPPTPAEKSLWYVYGTSYLITGTKMYTTGVFSQAPVITKLSMYMNTCNVSGTDKCITARIGFAEGEHAADWVEGAYKDTPLTNGAGYKYATLDAPWVPTPGREYKLCIELTEYGPSFVSTDFIVCGEKDNQDYAHWWHMSDYRKTQYFNGSAWVEYSRFPCIEIRGYDSPGACIELAEGSLAEAPQTFQTAINARSVSPSDIYDFDEIDPDNQFIFAEVSLDGGTNWTRLAPGEDLATPYTGTDVRYRMVIGNKSTDDVQVDGLALSYEV